MVCELCANFVPPEFLFCDVCGRVCIHPAPEPDLEEIAAAAPVVVVVESVAVESVAVESVAVEPIAVAPVVLEPVLVEPVVAFTEPVPIASFRKPVVVAVTTSETGGRGGADSAGAATTPGNNPVGWSLSFPDLPDVPDVLIDQNVVVLGREPKASARFPAAQLVQVDDRKGLTSKSHVRLEFHDGQWEATDMASVNGSSLQRTIIGGNRILMTLGELRAHLLGPSTGSR
jgi:hypothetical protein